MAWSMVDVTVWWMVAWTVEYEVGQTGERLVDRKDRLWVDETVAVMDDKMAGKRVRL